MVAARRIFLGAVLALFVSTLQGQERFITVASTTSTEQSGLFDHLLPIFERQTGIKVHVVALGTGQALDVARRGDADVVFVHARPAEEQFLADGHGVRRYPVMYNDFVLIGPKSDPAQIGGGKDFYASGQPKATVIFKGNKATIEGNDLLQKEYATFTIKIDPSTNPKCIPTVLVSTALALAARTSSIPPASTSARNVRSQS